MVWLSVRQDGLLVGLMNILVKSTVYKQFEIARDCPVPLMNTILNHRMTHVPNLLIS